MVDVDLVAQSRVSPHECVALRRWSRHLGAQPRQRGAGARVGTLVLGPVEVLLVVLRAAARARWRRGRGRRGSRARRPASRARCTAAIASMPLHQACACSAGDESCNHPAVAYGGASDGTWPSTRPMIQNGLPNHAGSASNQSIVGIGTSECSPSASITRNCVSKFVSRNTCVRLRRDARDEPVRLGPPSCPGRVEQHGLVREPGGRRDLDAADATSSSPATLAEPCAELPSGLVRVSCQDPHGPGRYPGSRTERPRARNCARPKSRQDAGGFDVDDKRIAMEIALSDDQEFFRDTTRKFLGSECPIPKVRSLRSNPDGLRARLLAAGRGAGLDVAARPRGARGRQRQRQRGGRPRARGRRLRRARRARPAASRATSWPPRWPARAATSSRASSSPPSSPATSSPPGPSPRCRPHDGLGDDRPPGRGRRVRVRPHGREITGRGGRAGRPAARHRRPPTPVLAQFLLPRRRRGVTVTPLRSVDLVRRYARIQFDGVQRPPRALSSASRATRPPTSSTSCRSPAWCSARRWWARPQVAFDLTLDWAFSRYSFGRPLASYQEIKHRFADMKMWLEASHGLADSRGAARRAERRRRRDRGQHGQGVRRRLPRRARAGLRAAARWHRRHLRARPPPVPPPHHRRPAHLRHAGRPPPPYRRPARAHAA